MGGAFVRWLAPTTDGERTDGERDGTPHTRNSDRWLKVQDLHDGWQRGSAVPRYFFHVFDDSQYIEDPKGVELIDLAEAKRELGRLVRLVPDRLMRPGVRVALHDDAGTMLAEQWIVRPS
jgi:hypothetical protein